MLISFSGLDGAGKSTLIGRLKENLEEHNRNVTVLNMWDHVGIYALLRILRDFVYRVFQKNPSFMDDRQLYSNDPELGLLLPERSLISGFLFHVFRGRIVKRIIYFFDLCLFKLIFFYFGKIKNHILIMDRYFYDSISDVTDKHQWFYMRLFLFFTPVPELPVFVDVSPMEAFARKGEYSVEYMKKRRVKYLQIFSGVDGALILENKNLEETICVLNGVVFERLKC